MEWCYCPHFDETVLRSFTHISIRKLLFDDRSSIRPDHAFERKPKINAKLISQNFTSLKVCIIPDIPFVK